VVPPVDDDKVQLPIEEIDDWDRDFIRDVELEMICNLTRVELFVLLIYLIILNIPNIFIVTLFIKPKQTKLVGNAVLTA